MNHDEIKAKISAFIDNELREDLKNEVFLHMQGCSECSAEAESLRKQDALLKGSGEINPSLSFRVRLNAKTTKKEPVKTGWINVGRLIPIPLALSILVMIFSVYMAAAPVIYGMNNSSVKVSASEMAKNTVISCMTASVFSPAAFAGFCGACTENACACCGAKCGPDCKMKMGGK
jgi:anti-sigma factor RsiW